MSGQPSRHKTLLRFSAINLAWLIFVWIADSILAERTWFTMLIAFSPQIFFLVPTALLFIVTVLRKSWNLFLVNVAASLIFGTLLLQPHWNTSKIHPAAPRITVMTYNIDRASMGLDQVCNVIRSLSPTVFCLQETENLPKNPWIIDGIRGRLKQYRVVQRGGMTLGSLLPVFSIRTIPIPPNPTARAAMDVTLDLSGTAVHVVVAHMTPVHIAEMFPLQWRSLPQHLREAARDQKQEADELLPKLQQIDAPVILCGDFNGPPQGLRYKQFASVMTDAFAHSGSGFGFTVRPDLPLMRVDFIFTNRYANPIATTVPAQIASDHFPVLSQIEITSAGSMRFVEKLRWPSPLAFLPQAKREGRQRGEGSGNQDLSSLFVNRQFRNSLSSR